MILSNVEILKAIQNNELKIDSLAGDDPTKAPFNTTAVDLRLAESLSIPEAQSISLDLHQGTIANTLTKISKNYQLSQEQPFCLQPNVFCLAQTLETVAFPLHLSARVEGKSSLARCGLMVHFTAPTIHAGFEGKITLEIINLGANPVILRPGMFICQLIIERVDGLPMQTPNQFTGQRTPAGL